MTPESMAVAQLVSASGDAGAMRFRNVMQASASGCEQCVWRKGNHHEVLVFDVCLLACLSVRVCVFFGHVFAYFLKMFLGVFVCVIQFVSFCDVSKMFERPAFNIGFYSLFSRAWGLFCYLGCSYTLIILSFSYLRLCSVHYSLLNYSTQIRPNVNVC